MTRTLKIISLAIGLTAFVLLAIMGFAIWVFLPLVPAGLIFAVAVVTLRSRAKRPVEHAEESDQRKAA